MSSEDTYIDILNYQKIIVQMKASEQSNLDKTITNDYISSLLNKLSSDGKLALIRSLIDTSHLYRDDAGTATGANPVHSAAACPIVDGDEEIEDLNKTELIKLKTWLIKAIFLTMVTVAIIVLFIIGILGVYGYSMPMMGEIKDIFNAIFSE